jgi:hypothetical protein
MRDLRRSDVNILTLGQYLRPTDGHLPIARYYTPDEFRELARSGCKLGFTHVQASPLTRSSYHAWEQADTAARRFGASKAQPIPEALNGDPQSRPEGPTPRPPRSTGSTSGRCC